MVDYEYYDWNNLLTQDNRQKMCSDVSAGIDSGKFWTNSPKYQTNWNVFQDFTDLKMSFLWSCFRYLGREVQIKNVQSWSFRTSLKHVENRDTLWHHHNHNTETKTVSGENRTLDDISGKCLASSRHSTVTTRPLYCSGRYGVLSGR